MAFVFIKQIISQMVSTIGEFSFGKLSSEGGTPPTLVMREGKINISDLGLKKGTYLITVTSCAEDFNESKFSNVIKITIT